MKQRSYVHKEISLKRLIAEIEQQISKLTELVNRPLLASSTEKSDSEQPETKNKG